MAQSTKHPPALLALGHYIATADAEWRRTDFEIAQLAQDALDDIAFDVAERDEKIRTLERKADEYLDLAYRWLQAQSNHPWEVKLIGQIQACMIASHEGTPSEARFFPPSG